MLALSEGDLDGAKREVETFLGETKDPTTFTLGVLEFLSYADPSELAAHGQGVMFAQILATSPSATLFEPLLVACRRSAGFVVDPPQEVGEVADDILREIEARRTLLSAKSPVSSSTGSAGPAATQSSASAEKTRKASRAKKASRAITARRPKRRGLA